MNKYYHYWRFFCDNTFAQEDKLQFFDDGSFAITTKGKKVSLYSNKAELIGCYENAFALDNGCICERHGDNIIIHSSVGEQYYIPCPAVSHVKQLPNSVAFKLKLEDEIQVTSELYFVTPNKKDMRHHSFTEGFVENVSPLGMVVLQTSEGNKLLDTNLTEIPLAPFHRITFLPQGGYIVYFKDVASGCALYNARNERLLASSQDFGIQPLGDKVLYEQALIISPKSGSILKEYAGEKVIYKYMFVYTYRIERRGLSDDYPRHLWLGGELLSNQNQTLGWLLYYWNDGHFYVAPQVVFTDSKFQTLCTRDNSFAWQHYLMRIRAIMSRK